MVLHEESAEIMILEKTSCFNYGFLKICRDYYDFFSLWDNTLPFQFTYELKHKMHTSIRLWLIPRLVTSITKFVYGKVKFFFFANLGLKNNT